MTLIRQFFIITILTLCSLTALATQSNATAPANPKRTVNHNQDFSLTRPIAITIPNYQRDAKNEIEAMVKDNGGQIEGNFFKKLFSSPRIILRQSKQIVGARGDNAMKIEVSFNKVTITYTTELSLLRAMELLKMQLAFRQGGAVIAGMDIIDWVDVNYAPRKHRVGDLDLAAGTSLLPRSQIESIIARTKRGDALEIAVVTPAGWVIETPALDGINPSCKIYSAIGYYSLAHIKSLNDYAASRGVELILKTNLLDGNENFEKCTGFAMNTVEGMRFVRAMLTHWTAATGITTFVIGGENSVADKRYQEFLDFLQKTLNIKLTKE